MEGPRPPPTSPRTATANTRPGRGVGPYGLRAAAAELTEAPNGRRAQEASGRRLQGANGPAEASGTRLNGRVSYAWPSAFGVRSRRGV